MNEREQMLANVLSCDRLGLYSKEQSMTQEQSALLDQMIGRRAQGEPLQYILGDVNFMGHTLVVSPSVLIPRPETEILVDSAIEKLKKRQHDSLEILDLGTGSGNIAISLAKHFKNSKVTAVDISLEALRVARRNVALNQVEDQVSLICMDMGKFLNETRAQKQFDLIISNPPYIETSFLKDLPEDVKHEPFLALDGGWDGCHFYRQIIDCAHVILKNNGFIFLEIGDNQDVRISKYLNDNGCYQNISLIKDYVGTNRIICAQKS